MVLLKHEFKQNIKQTLIWSMAISFFLIICIALYPQMQTQMQDVSNMFSNLGAFSQAFGLDQLNFGSFNGFYSVECGNVLGIGGALFAAIIATSSLSKEKKEFLYIHPLSKTNIALTKLSNTYLQILILNIICFSLSLLTSHMVHIEYDLQLLMLLHLAYMLCQLQIASICFALALVLKKANLGLGIAIPLMLYFFNLIMNISSDLELLKYVTPFAYTNAPYMMEHLALNYPLILLGMASSLVIVGICLTIHQRQDL